MIETLETSRLILRRPENETLEHIRQWFADPEVMRFQGGVLSNEQIDSVLSRIQDHWATYGFGHFLIFIKDQKDPIGLVSLKYLNDDDAKINLPDLGFIIIPPYWKNGYAVEAAKDLLKYAKDGLSFAKVQAANYASNTAGNKVLLKLGFQFVGDKEIVTYGRNFGMASQWEIVF